MMDWDDLRTFLAVARHGSLSAAARALGVSQPTMGRRLAAMEDRNGARLLQRLPGGYALTPLGESVLGHAERIEAEALAAERAIRGRDVALAGTVRVTTVDVLAAYVVAPAIADLQCTHPGISVELVPDTRTLNLSRREADIALRPSRFEGAEVVARRAGAMAMGLYAAPALLERTSDPLPLVTVLDDQATLPEARWLRDLHPDSTVAVRSNSREVQLTACRAGAGVAVLARMVGDAQPGLVRMPEARPCPLRDLWLGVHADMRAMPRVRAVMDAILAGLKTNEGVLVPAPGSSS